MEKLKIRRVASTDLAAIAEIYSCAVLRRQTAHTIPPDPAYWAAWLLKHDAAHPAFVMEREGETIGFASLSPYREGRQAFEKVAEISYYLRPDHQGRGYGTHFVKNAIHSAKEMGTHFLVAILLGSNKVSEGLLYKLGFEKWGEMPGIADFGEMQDDHLYLGRKL